MLHLVISTPRSGSNSLCKFLSAQHSAVNLYEPVTDHRDSQNDLTKPIGSIIKELLVAAKSQNIVVKFHIDHLLLLFPKDKLILIDLFSQSKLYYCLRLNFAEQIKSMQGIELTSVCDQRTEKAQILINSADANKLALKLVNEIGIMGEWYKAFKGELNVLEHMSETYSNNGSPQYNDTYSFVYDSEYTRQFIHQHVDVLEVFNKGNSLYSF